MKVLLQHTVTHRFLKPGGGWTSDENNAQKFSNSIVALDHCLENAIRGMQVVFKFEQLGRDVIIPLKN